MKLGTSASGVLGRKATSVDFAVRDGGPTCCTAELLADSTKDAAEGERFVGAVLSVHFEIAESMMWRRVSQLTVEHPMF